MEHITPPFGYTMFAFKATVPGLPISDVYRAAWPFVGVFVLLMILIVAIPQIATWLPSIM